MDARFDALEEKLNRRIERINLMLIFLIILNIVAMTLLNPNFVSILKMLLGR